MCYCKWCEAVLAVVIIVLAWPKLIVWQYYAWVIIISAALILVHRFGCRCCGGCCTIKASALSGRAKRKRR
jgi:hypothetical protein